MDMRLHAQGIDGALPKARASFVRRLIAEPLLQFMLMGAAIFAVAHIVEHHRAAAERRILVDEAVKLRLSRLYELQMGSLPSADTLKRLVDDHVHDEILYREALKLGIDQSDEIIRRRLIQKIEFINHDLIAVEEPSEAQLRDYYAEHAAEFVDPARVSFSHVYFSPDQGGAAAAQQRALKALAALRKSGKTRAPEVGDRFPLQYDYAQLDQQDIAQIFGRTPIVEGLLQAPVGTWTGPLQSGYGWHLVRVDAARGEKQPSFEEVRTAVREGWQQQARAAANQRYYDDLRAQYEVVGDNAAGAP